MVQKRAVVRQSLPDLIVSDLRKRILSGELAEGCLIRQEMLAEEYDVSRMPIREALKRLDAEGLVVFQNNRGATVTKHTLEEIAEIFDVRILLEADLFRRAIPNMKNSDFHHCQNLLEEMDESYSAGRVADWGPLNSQFHSALYEAADRTLTNSLLERVSLQANRYVALHIDLLNHTDSARSDHTTLLELAKNGQVEDAVQSLTSHLESTKEQVLAYVERTRKSSD
ncbi:GntR family transcriptional regulator [Marinomonas mediterranea]|uniref:Transcriptional regulator, GntR family n=1 Tax=Marinomonas mediterranea (strain ATCC 700492 / JCM 21426 / NBRC 103028 / MMB-1) TaxID=717774 RepID=F2JUK7_MARM1|nr:GntR family transcriptional regulator [Marinomonas mediterranea]ADZ89340.1 transcriptional regulator, GntR family [Marinomonas mediterranea MMB-1]WCN07442.1 FCD domain-containing protein [Marinomonas mediterranea]WCN11538.1 FCD domain-containing protein [Marinomonas mediterranea]WCN15605.1 FCD domain-containing protein [Marinomonas mediterranea MMB-1]